MHGISWTIRKQSARRSRQITTEHLITQTLTGRMLFLTPNQQCESSEGRNSDNRKMTINIIGLNALRYTAILTW